MIDVDAGQLPVGVAGVHNCRAKVHEVAHVSERLGNQPVWDGNIHLRPGWPPDGIHALRLSSGIEETERCRFYAVVHMPPVTSPGGAVHAAIVQDYRSGHR